MKGDIKMPQVNITVLDKTNLPGKMQDIITCAKRGVKIATESGVEFIKEEVMEGQRYVGSEFYPDVKPETKQRKAEAGKEKVGIDTENLKSSFDSRFEHGGLAGIITGGGPEYGEFSARWQIDELFRKERGEKSRELIRGEIKKGI